MAVQYGDQEKVLDRGVDVLIATPGRLLDHFQAAGNITLGYGMLFGFCGGAYLLAFIINHLLTPRFEPVKLIEN